MAKIKVLITGSPRIGKSHLLDSLKDINQLNYIPTWGVDLHIEFHNGHKIYLYDAGGHPSIEKLKDKYYDKVDLVVLMFSYNQPKSFKMLNKELEKINKYAPSAGLLVVGSQYLSKNQDMPIVKQTSVNEFIITHGIKQFIKLDTKKQTDLSNFLDRCLYRQTLTERANKIVRYSTKYGTFWDNSKSIINNIEQLFGNYAGLDRHPCLFALLHPKRHFKREVQVILKQISSKEPDDAKRLIQLLEALSSKENGSLSRRIAYAKDEIQKSEAKYELAIDLNRSVYTSK